MVFVSLTRRLGLLIAVALLSACRSEPPAKPVRAADCGALGRHVQLQKVHGIIYAGLDTKVQISACPGVEMQMSMIESTSADMERLLKDAESQKKVIGFYALGDGYVVQERGGQYLLLALTMDRVAVDPKVEQAADKIIGK
jgi:hypothetical protein